MPRAFITGITGQDGSYLAEQLLALDWDVFGVGREAFPAESSAASSEALHVEQLNTLDWPPTRDFLDASDPDVVFNLAGLSSVAQSWKDPGLTMELNASVPARLLEWIEGRAYTGRAVRLVQASSSEIFGDSPDPVHDESTPLNPLNPYGESKAKAHRLVQAARARGVHASNAILYNHESPRRPEHFVTRKISAAVARIAGGSGEVLRLGNLEARRDWGWAPDYVDAMSRMAQAPSANDYIVATGESHSVQDFVSAAFGVVAIADWQHLVLKEPSYVRPADIRESVGNPARAKRELNWRPTVGFEELVARMVVADVTRLEQSQSSS